jgi:hypothetical protein
VLLAEVAHTDYRRSQFLFHIKHPLFYCLHLYTIVILFV